MDYFEVLEKIFMTTLVALLIVAVIGFTWFMFYSIFNPSEYTCRTIIEYETRQCTVFSDYSEECKVIERG